MLKIALPLIALLFLSGCIDVNSQAIASGERISNICIQRNPKVIVPDFINLLQAAIARHNIKSSIADDVPKNCKYHMTYVAYQRWDFTMFMSNAHLDLYKGDQIIGYSDRKMPIGSGFDFSKWDSNTTKINEMVDQLLADVAPLPPQTQLLHEQP